MKSTCFANTNTNVQNPLKHVDSIRSFKNLNFVRMKYLFLLCTVIFCLSTNNLSFAQNCKNLNNWVETAEAEFPDLNYKSLRSGSDTYDRIRFNLLSDKFFVPIFGESFDKMRNSKRTRIRSKIRRCADNHKYPNLERLKFYMWGAFTQGRAYNEGVEQVRQLRKLRQELETITREIQSENTPFSKFDEYNELPDTKFKMLVPSEVEYLSKTIKDNKVRAANKELVDKANRINDLDNNYSSINPLISFKKDNLSAYRTADQNVKKKVDNIISDKANKILDNVLAGETAALNTINNISDINLFYNGYDSRFKSVSDYEQVRKVYSEIISKKTSVISKQQESILDEIKNADTHAQLNNLERKYLRNVLASNSAISHLSNTINRRREEIIAERKRRTEEQKRERKLAEAKALEKFGFKFNTEGLNNKKLIENIFKGNFLEIPFNRDDMFFAGMIKGYMYAYANNCTSSLPANMVQIFRDVCTRERVTYNGWGVETNRYCIEWAEEPTGLYASPELYQAYKTVKNISDRDGLRNAWKLMAQMTRDNTFSAVGELVMDTYSTQSDMAGIIRLNGCNNKALERFEENMIRFANNEPPLKLDGSAETEKMDYSQEQNFNRLIDDLIYVNSRGWAVNKYIRNSVENIRVSKDSNNRPIAISAKYSFNGFFGRQKYSVRITFENGTPDCIYFQDYPNTCRTADRKVVADFVQGKYVMD